MTAAAPELSNPKPRAYSQYEKDSIKAYVEQGYSIKQISHYIGRPILGLTHYCKKQQLRPVGSPPLVDGCQAPGCTGEHCGANPAGPEYRHHIGDDLRCNRCGLGLAHFQITLMPCWDKPTEEGDV